MVCLSGGVLNRVDPLGARCVMGALESRGEEFGLFLQDRLEQRPAIVRKIVAFEPDILWVSIQPLTPDIFGFVKTLRRALPGIPIVLGNVGARGFDEHELLSSGEKTVVVLGQGEEAAVRLLELYRADPALDGESLAQIANLRFCREGRIVQTAFRPDQIKQTVVPSAVGLKEAVERGDVINARASNGCDAHCTFCTVRLINNGQSWKPLPPAMLVSWLERMVAAGKRDGTIPMTDDDLAGSLENLHAVAEAFKTVNARHGCRLDFNFSTRANHLFNPKDSAADDARRVEVWRFCVDAGLRNVFLGLESGSDTQLRRYGKGCTAETNRRALARARELGITVEIGFIPIDQMMTDLSWRTELRDNIALAREARVAVSCPTWLAPSRVYRGAPLAKHLSHNGLLGTLNLETEEYETSYLSDQVVQLLRDLGPALCEGEGNGYYRFKRELKAALRYPIAVTAIVGAFGEAVIGRELDFVERLTRAASRAEVHRAQSAFAEDVLGLLVELQARLMSARSVDYSIEFMGYTANASRTLSEWLMELRARPERVEGGVLCPALA